MKRRRILIGGVPLTGRTILHSGIKDMMREKFKDAAYVDKFLETLVASGWTSLDIDSTVTQNANTHRPPVEAFLFHNEHVLDQLRLTQSVYTNMRDTAADPNYVIRHPAQAELILRRLTPGDLMLLQAAHYRSASLTDDFDGPAEDDDDYWQTIWRALFGQLDNRGIPYDYGITLSRDPLKAFGSALDFLYRTMDTESESLVTTTQAYNTFFRPESSFYTGAKVRFDRVRAGDSFEDTFVVTNLDNGTESAYMAACVIFCYAIDNEARSVQTGLTSFSKKTGYATKYLNLARNCQFTKIQMSLNNADQEAVHLPQGIDASRLLP